MQSLKSLTFEKTKKEKIQQLEKSMRDILVYNKSGAVFVCPYCNYESRKNPKGSAKIFENKYFKCFSCGIWRCF